VNFDRDLQYGGLDSLYLHAAPEHLLSAEMSAPGRYACEDLRKARLGVGPNNLLY
jgi:hypothetical protein